VQAGHDDADERGQVSEGAVLVYLALLGIGSALEWLTRRRGSARR